ncbi:MAG: YmdB family metallophosphoesterase, partial [Candidatus Omnitrophota bacterium]
MKILFIGDIVGKPARLYLSELLPGLRKELGLDCIIANGENSAGGSSVTRDTANDLFGCGIDVLTSGDHIFKKKESHEVLATQDLIRPLNYGDMAAG